MSIINKIINNIMSKDASTMIASNLLDTFNVSGMWWCTSSIVKEVFPTVTTNIGYHEPLEKSASHFSKDYRECHPSQKYESGAFQLCNYHHTFYKGRLIILGLYRENLTDRSTRYSTVLMTPRSKDSYELIREFIHEMLITAKIKSERHFIREIQISEAEKNSFRIHSYLSKTPELLRTFNNVFIEDDILTQITSSIDSFVSKREWYEERHLPYHFGILLYGEPGTGKTSIVQAMAEEYDMSILFVDASYPEQIPYIISSAVNNKSSEIGKPQIVLIEDVDCAMLTQEYDNEGKCYSRGTNLGPILNVMDGLTAVPGIIYILTTNHIDKLDPALIRPGRIDLKCEIKHVNYETLNKFLDFHYGKKCTRAFKVRDGITFAELQVQVMTGKSFDDIVKYCKTKPSIDKK